MSSVDPLGLFMSTSQPPSDPPSWAYLAFEGSPSYFNESSFFCMLFGSCISGESGNSGGGDSATTAAAKQPGSLPPCNNFTLDSADTFRDDQFATPEQVDAFVSAQAMAPAAWDGYNAAVAFSNAGINPALALGIIGAETSFNPTARGRVDPFSSGGTSFSSSLSRGLATIVKIQYATYSNSTPLAALWDANNPLPVRKGVIGQQYVADGTGPTTWKAGVQTWFRKFARFIGKCK